MEDTITKILLLRGILLTLYRAKIMASYLFPRCANAIEVIFRHSQSTFSLMTATIARITKHKSTIPFQEC